MAITERVLNTEDSPPRRHC